MRPGDRDSINAAVDEALRTAEADLATSPRAGKEEESALATLAVQPAPAAQPATAPRQAPTVRREPRRRTPAARQPQTREIIGTVEQARAFLTVHMHKRQALPLSRNPSIRIDQVHLDRLTIHEPLLVSRQEWHGHREFMHAPLCRILEVLGSQPGEQDIEADRAPRSPSLSSKFSQQHIIDLFKHSRWMHTLILSNIDLSFTETDFDAISERSDESDDDYAEVNGIKRYPTRVVPLNVEAFLSELVRQAPHIRHIELPSYKPDAIEAERILRWVDQQLEAGNYNLVRISTGNRRLNTQLHARFLYTQQLRKALNVCYKVLGMDQQFNNLSGEYNLALSAERGAAARKALTLIQRLTDPRKAVFTPAQLAQIKPELDILEAIAEIACDGISPKAFATLIVATFHDAFSRINPTLETTFRATSRVHPSGLSQLIAKFLFATGSAEHFHPLSNKLSTPAQYYKHAWTLLLLKSHVSSYKDALNTISEAAVQDALDHSSARIRWRGTFDASLTHNQRFYFHMLLLTALEKPVSPEAQQVLGDTHVGKHDYLTALFANDAAIGPGEIHSLQRYIAKLHVGQRPAKAFAYAWGIRIADFRELSQASQFDALNMPSGARLENWVAEQVARTSKDLLNAVAPTNRRFVERMLATHTTRQAMTVAASGYHPITAAALVKAFDAKVEAEILEDVEQVGQALIAGAEAYAAHQAKRRWNRAHRTDVSVIKQLAEAIQHSDMTPLEKLQSLQALMQLVFGMAHPQQSAHYGTLQDLAGRRNGFMATSLNALQKILNFDSKSGTRKHSFHTLVLKALGAVEAFKSLSERKAERPNHVAVEAEGDGAAQENESHSAADLKQHFLLEMDNLIAEYQLKLSDDNPADFAVMGQDGIDVEIDEEDGDTARSSLR